MAGQDSHGEEDFRAQALQKERRREEELEKKSRDKLEQARIQLEEEKKRKQEEIERKKANGEAEKTDKGKEMKNWRH